MSIIYFRSLTYNTAARDTCVWQAATLSDLDYNLNVNSVPRKTKIVLYLVIYLKFLLSRIWNLWLSPDTSGKRATADVVSKESIFFFFFFMYEIKSNDDLKRHMVPSIITSLKGL